MRSRNTCKYDIVGVLSVLEKKKDQVSSRFQVFSRRGLPLGPLFFLVGPVVLASPDSAGGGLGRAHAVSRRGRAVIEFSQRCAVFMYPPDDDASLSL